MEQICGEVGDFLGHLVYMSIRDEQHFFGTNWWWSRYGFFVGDITLLFTWVSIPDDKKKGGEKSPQTIQQAAGNSAGDVGMVTSCRGPQAWPRGWRGVTAPPQAKIETDWRWKRPPLFKKGKLYGITPLFGIEYCIYIYTTNDMFQTKNYNMEPKFPKLSIFFSFHGIFDFTHYLYLWSFLQKTQLHEWIRGWQKPEAPTANFQELNPKINLFLDTKLRFFSEISEICFGDLEIFRRIEQNK